MTTAVQTEAALGRELNDFQDRFPTLKKDELFVLWFLRAFVADSSRSAADALCGGSGDKGIDAVLIDDHARMVFVVQGKYREKVAAKNEPRADIIAFAQLASVLCDVGRGLHDFSQDLAPEVQKRLEEARSRIRKRAYALQLFYVTMGKCSRKLREEAERIVRAAEGAASFQLLDGRRVLRLLSDYLDGVAPPVPSLKLEIEAGHGVTGKVGSRYDPRTDIDSWFFSMTGSAIAGLYEGAGVRLFARNVRGFLGSTKINRGMETTLDTEPEYFWYYNNGVTIVCDEAKYESSHGQNVLHVENPQIINGQQTTRTLARNKQAAGRASVLVRVIRVPRTPHDADHDFETLVSKIVAATNWQNAILPSDLMANDRRQIEIERALRKLQYLYLRKRMTKGEARQAANARYLHLIKKDEMAQAVAACDLDPFLVRQGKEGLFEEAVYSQVFPNADPNYYLSRYWLMRMVSRAVRGYPERAYAKWLALHFAWNRAASSLQKDAAATAFRRACERGAPHLVEPLISALNSLLVATLRFYRANRGSGPTAIDVSTFFKRPGLHKKFATFWSEPRNKSRGPFDRAWRRFERALADG